MYYTIPGTTKSVKLQSGQFWSLTCRTKLVGTVTDIAIVIDEIQKTLVEDKAKEIDFHLDIMCCDPNEPDCKKCESVDLDGKIPIMKIGPKSDANSRFFVKTGMDTHNRELGYFHIEKLYYQGFDHSGTLINKFDVIENGCNRVGPLVEFKGEFTVIYLFSTLTALN